MCGPTVSGADSLSLSDSALTVTMKRFPSCCPKAFPYVSPVPSTPSHMLGALGEVPSTLVRHREPNPTYLRKPKPSRGVFGPRLHSLGGLGEGVSTVPP